MRTLLSSCVLAAMVFVVATGCGSAVAETYQSEQEWVEPSLAPAPAPIDYEALKKEKLPRPGEFMTAKALTSVTEGRLMARKAKPLTGLGFLFVETNPPTAEVQIDQADMGRGRVFSRERHNRMIRITVKAAGYESVDGYVELTENQVTKLKVDLLRIGGGLTILSEPYGVRVRVDGELVGTSPITAGRLSAGSHAVKLESGDWMWEDSVQVRQGEINVLSVPVGIRSPSETSMSSAQPVPAETAKVKPVATPVVRSEPVVEPAPAVQSEPVAQVVRAPEPAPEPEPEPEPAPTTVATTSSEPAVPATPVSPEKRKAGCERVCGQFVKAVESDSMREPIKSLCLKRCIGGDMPFTVCAWKVKTMSDVLACGALPESKQ